MRERISLLHAITAAMLRILDLELLLPEIVHAACALETADAATLMLADEDGATLRIVAHRGVSAEYAAAQRIPMERARAIYRGFDTPVELDLRSSPPGDPALIRREGLARVVALPLLHEGALIGALNIYTRDPERRFNEVDVEILHVLAAQASIAITNARLYQQERSARSLQESLLEAVTDGVVIAFPDGSVRLNRAARALFGITDGRPTFDRVEMRRLIDLRRHEDDRPVAAGSSPFDRAFRGEAMSGLFTFNDLVKGERHVARLSVEAVVGTAGTVVAGVLTVHDLTQQRELERQKDEFVSIVSHELKTPLTPLKALAQLIRMRVRRHRTDGRPLDLDSLEANLRTIERQVDRMSALVNDLLEVSRAGQGRFEVQPTDLDLMPMVRDIVRRHGELVSEEGRHRFVVEGPETLTARADSLRLEQAIANLVANAVKYSPQGGLVRVAVAEADGMVTVAVSDEGIGILAEDLAVLGRPFARGTGRARTFSGMGLGLYLARLVAERHGGSLELRSAGEDAGTTVTLSIPRTAASGAHSG